MSIEAHRWALAQRTRSATTQCVLYVLANAADPEGVAFRWWKRREHWWPYLTERTRATRATLFRIFDEFEEAGLLSREKVAPADGGRPTFHVALHLDRYVTWDDKIGVYVRVSAQSNEAEPARVPSQAETEESERGGVESVVPSQAETEQDYIEGDDEASPVSPGDTGESQPATPYEESACKSPGKESPPTPSLPAARPQGPSREGKSTTTEPIGFRSCFEGYPDWQLMARDKALATYLELGDADHALLARAVPLHAAKLAVAKRKPRNFHLWVRARGFDAYAPGAAPNPTGHRDTFVAEHTPAHDAWTAAATVMFGGETFGPTTWRARQGHEAGILAPSAWPLGDETWLIPRSRWVFVEQYTARYNRWSERTHEIFGRPLRAMRFRGAGASQAFGRGHDGGLSEPNPLGAFVPLEWPPPKTERKPGADPPAELSDEDSRELANL